VRDPLLELFAKSGENTPRSQFTPFAPKQRRPQSSTHSVYSFRWRRAPTQGTPKGLWERHFGCVDEKGRNSFLNVFQFHHLIFLCPFYFGSFAELPKFVIWRWVQTGQIHRAPYPPGLLETMLKTSEPSTSHPPLF